VFAQIEYLGLLRAHYKCSTQLKFQWSKNILKRPIWTPEQFSKRLFLASSTHRVCNVIPAFLSTK